MTAALDRAVANALGLKSVHNCEKWSKTMIKEDIHSCGYHCQIPACIKAQRDELVDRFVKDTADIAVKMTEHYFDGWNNALDEAAAHIGEIKGFGQTTQDSFAVYIKVLKK